MVKTILAKTETFKNGLKTKTSLTIFITVFFCIQYVYIGLSLKKRSSFLELVRYIKHVIELGILNITN